MNILNVPLVVAVGGALIVLGCDRERAPRPETGVAPRAEAPAAQRPLAPVADPSVPSASSAVGAASTPN